MNYGKVHRLDSDKHGGFDPDHEIVVQEKLDGSQFSFWAEGDQLVCCSRSGPLNILQPPAMFAKAVATARMAHSLGLTRYGAIYGEAFQRKRHNVLEYEREPAGGLVMFEQSPHMGNMTTLAKEIGCEVVAEIYRGPLLPKDELRKLASGDSPTLGGRREGVVVKQFAPTYTRAKIVSAEFSEVKVRKSEPRGENPVAELGRLFAQPARYAKAVQRLREQGKITDSERDIGLIIAEVRRDMFEEESDAIAGQLLSIFQKEIARTAVAPVAEWYKARLDGGGAC